MHNANAFLDMTPDAVSGKTGFTGNAGYCYVAACENDGRSYIIALLGCGWPNNKTYKWKDTMKLLEYGKANYHKVSYWKEPRLPEVTVKGGVPEAYESWKDGAGKSCVRGVIQAETTDKKKQVLVKEDEKVVCTLRMEKELQAPVKKGQGIGRVIFSLGEVILDEYPVVSDRNIGKITYIWCINKVFHDFFH